MNLLFITRKYPPMVGGMEKMSFALAKEFQKNANTTLITWGKSQKYLPFFLISAFLKSLYLIPSKKIEHIHLGDGLLSPLGVLLKYLFGIKTTITIAGLDITFKFPPYQFLIPKCVAKLDKVICISNATLEECVKRGIPREKCIFIPCGVYPEEFQIQATRKDLEKIIDKNLEGKKILITVGRLIERKGVYWFVKHVVPKLNQNALYLVVGDGPEIHRIKSLIDKLDISKQVLLLGKVSDKELKIIYNTADIFLMPNIPIKGDIEGFGIVAIEATSTGLITVASEIEGIKDVITNNRNGYLIESLATELWVTKLKSLLVSTGKRRSDVKQWTFDHFSWNSIGQNYLHTFNFFK